MVEWRLYKEKIVENIDFYNKFNKINIKIIKIKDKIYC